MHMIPLGLLAAVGLNLSFGLTLGVLGGMLGIGGGLIAIPLLARLYGMDQQLAQGTALILVVPNVLIGFLRYRQRHPVNLRHIGAMLLPALIAAHLSARLAIAMDPRSLRLTFAAFLVALAAFMAWQRGDGRGQPARAPLLSARCYPLVGLLSGVMSGLFTIGGGLIVVPALMLLFGTAQTAAQGMALAMVLPGAIVALFSYAQAGQVDWGVGLPLAAGGILTVSLGVSIAHALPPRRLRWLFCATLLGTAVAVVA